jgi:phenylalanyl-tRNA synthetase beta chain
MLAPVSWLADYIDIGDLSPADLADALTMCGLEVEDLRDRLAFLSTVVAARVESEAPHGRIRLLTVDAGGRGRLEILCGDPLVAVGSLHPLALLGTQLPAGPVKERVAGGAASRGVLCSEMELGLSADASKVMGLPPGAIPGQPLSELVGTGDWVLELSVTPNRADALSMIGVARDLGAVLDRPLRLPRTPLAEGGPSAFGQVAVSIECPDHCWRYCGRVVNSVTARPSPELVARRLFAAGSRPISNLVDVTNYVMLETGQPLHAFDLKKIAGRAITVRSYGPGTVLVTLDGQERTMRAEDNIMICDAERPVGLGGVMGGLNTEVDGSTTDVFLEAACFNPVTIRKTSRGLNLSTDASYRFERGQDPNGCPTAADRAAWMTADLGGGVVARGLIDDYPRPMRPKVVDFSPDRCNALSGAGHRPEAMARVLAAVGVGLEGIGGPLWRASLPTWRPDLAREVDLIEEVVRLADFRNLPATLPRPTAPASPPPRPFRLRQRLREILSGQGWSEHVGYSFIGRDFAVRLGLPEGHPWRTALVDVLNPLSEEMAVLRPSLVPGLIDALRLNQYRGQWDVALFESGTVFAQGSPKPLEFQRLAGVLAGHLGAGLWCDPKRPVDFWDAKGALEALGRALGIDLGFAGPSAASPAEPFLDPGQAAGLTAGGRPAGCLGRLGAAQAKALGLKEAGGRVFVFELDIEDLPAEPERTFQGWSSYPGVVRDLAVVVDRGLPASEILSALSGRGRWPLASANVFDLYQGDQVPAGKKSLALRLFFQDFSRTLTDELVNGYFSEIVATLSESFGAELRG